MSVKGFLLKDGTTAKYDYEALDNLPVIPSGSGLSDEAKRALLALLEKVAYVDENGQTYYDALEIALYPPANLVRISAVYTQSGTVYDTDRLADLKADLVVTAYMDDGTTRTVAEYALSGTLADGASTITVSYGGKTATFNVTVSAVAMFETTVPMTLATKVNARTGVEEAATNSIVSDYIELDSKWSFISAMNLLGNANGVSGMSGAFYDESKLYISGFDDYYYTARAIPEGNVKYVRLNVDKVAQRETERFCFYPFSEGYENISSDMQWSESATGKITNGVISTTGGDAFVSQIYPLESNTKGVYVKVNGGFNWMYFACYDENDTYISTKDTGPLAKNTIFYVPDNAKKIALQAHPTNSANTPSTIEVYMMK